MKAMLLSKIWRTLKNLPKKRIISVARLNRAGQPVAYRLVEEDDDYKVYKGINYETLRARRKKGGKVFEDTDMIKVGNAMISDKGYHGIDIYIWR